MHWSRYLHVRFVYRWLLDETTQFRTTCWRLFLLFFFFTFLWMMVLHLEYKILSFVLLHSLIIQLSSFLRWLLLVSFGLFWELLGLKVLHGWSCWSWIKFWTIYQGITHTYMIYSRVLVLLSCRWLMVCFYSFIYKVRVLRMFVMCSHFLW